MYPLTRLKLSMIATLALIFSITSLLISVILSLVGSFGYIALIQILTLVTILHIAQWMFAPYVIEALYRVHHIEPSDPRYGWLVDIVSSLAKRSGIRKRIIVGIAKIDIPNAFAYESPLTGPRIAITERLLRIAPPNEIEAVIAHELGHIKHRDVAVMMIISLIPALLYWLGYAMLRMGTFYSLGERRSNIPVIAIAVGIALIALTFVFNLIVLYFSRLREYYADAHAVAMVERGGTKLKRALTRILVDCGYLRRLGIDLSRYSHLKALFISDPEVELNIGPVRYLTPEYLDMIAEKIKSLPPRGEILSSHPHPAKRFRVLEELESILKPRFR